MFICTNTNAHLHLSRAPHSPSLCLSFIRSFALFFLLAYHHQMKNSGGSGGGGSNNEKRNAAFNFFCAKNRAAGTASSSHMKDQPVFRLQPKHLFTHLYAYITYTYLRSCHYSHTYTQIHYISSGFAASPAVCLFHTCDYVAKPKYMYLFSVYSVAHTHTHDYNSLDSRAF